MIAFAFWFLLLASPLHGFFTTCCGAEGECVLCGQWEFGLFCGFKLWFWISESALSVLSAPSCVVRELGAEISVVVGLRFLR